MKIPAAFKLVELSAIIGVCLLIAVGVVGFAPEFLFQVAHFLWLPFLLISALFAGKYALQRFPAHSFSSKPTKLFFLILKIASAFLLIIFCYFGLGQGLLLYQIIAYDALGQPVLTQFSNKEQLLWALQLGLLTWVIASGLALAMGALNKKKISQIFPMLANQHKRYALVIDTIIAFSVLFLLMLFMSIACIEISRSIIAFLGFERPVFPELTAIVLVIVLIAGYFVFALKKRSEKLAEKSVSIGRLLLMQGLWVSILLLIGGALVNLLPLDMIITLMKPILNLFLNLPYEKTWLYTTIAVAIMSAPLLARFFVHCCAGRTIWQVFLILIIPVGFSLGIQYSGLEWVPMAYLAPITMENILYQVHPAQFILMSSVLCLLLCFTFSKSLQVAMVELMPQHVGQRLRHLRARIANQGLSFVFLCSFYLFFANYGYYFFSNILLVLVTLSLLLVSIHLFYNLTSKSEL